MKWLLILIMLILCGGIVSAASPFQQQSDFATGYNIKVPEKEYFKLGQSYNFEFHVFNITDGVPKQNGIGCYLHLYNQTGEHIYTAFKNISDNNFDYGFMVNGNNFTTIGIYYYNIQCNNSILGGYAGQYIYVTAQGVPYSTIHGLVYVCIFGLLIGLFILLVYLVTTINSDNYRDGEGKVIAINWNKYIKIFLFAMAYITFIAIVYFAWNLSYGILEFKEMEKFFEFVFRTSFILIYPIFVIIIIVGIAQFIKDRKVEEFVKRNLSFK